MHTSLYIMFGTYLTRVQPASVSGRSFTKQGLAAAGMLEGWRCCRTHERAREAEQSGKKRLEEITFGHFGGGKWVIFGPKLLEAT